LLGAIVHGLAIASMHVGDGRHLLRGAGRQRRAECDDGYAELLADLSACGNLSLLALLSTQYRLA